MRPALVLSDSSWLLLEEQVLERDVAGSRTVKVGWLGFVPPAWRFCSYSLSVSDCEPGLRIPPLPALGWGCGLRSARPGEGWVKHLLVKRTPREEQRVRHWHREQY
ncbi:hypothetical protein chiPu_0013368 [Chiloscyllium punctatum]|uniref:Uncharacterized protein n=1 Tax=Chiloscyllium punctatum TaxID=137246 RepID=A0A401SWY3_CHIPU|nr:hypothetical protein [Chiloscyllium punctatum]